LADDGFLRARRPRTCLQKETISMNCPVCAETQLMMAERMGVEIDYCPRCRGVWLDRGELDRLLAADAARDPRGASPPVYGQPGEPQPDRRPPYDGRRRDDDDDDRYYDRDRRPRKRESWLGELFDF
jgi:Zn-finger nucleic acid-binding protein